MKQHGECIVNDLDWMEVRNKIGDTEMALLIILKSNDAPILGMVDLKPDMKNYIWQREEHTMKNVIRFAWKPNALLGKED